MATGLVENMEIHGGEEPWVEAVLPMTLGELIDMNIEELNDYAETNICDGLDALIMDIGYQVDGCDVENNVVKVKVTASLDYWV